MTRPRVLHRGTREQVVECRERLVTVGADPDMEVAQPVHTRADPFDVPASAGVLRARTATLEQVAGPFGHLGSAGTDNAVE